MSDDEKDLLVRITAVVVIGLCVIFAGMAIKAAGGLICG